MNWLAHALLSPAEPEVRLGNLLADCLKGRDRQHVSKPFRAGLQLHAFIDRFTDSHPLVHRSIARLQGAYPLVGGILIDIFYDHLLARRWAAHHPEPLERFLQPLYTDLSHYAAVLPAELGQVLARIIREDRLGSYRHLEGIQTALRSVSRRLSVRTGRHFHLEEALGPMLEQIDDYQADFEAFFPELRAAAQAHWQRCGLAGRV